MMMAIPSRRFATGASSFVRWLSTEAKPAAAQLQQEDSLYRRLSKLGRNEGAVASTINEYIREGRPVKKFELDLCVKELRKYKRYSHALEIIEWMEARKFNFGHKDCAVRLDLIGKARGLAAAENYFSGLSPSAKVPCTYGSLLNCYCKVKMTDKALNLFSKMLKENMISKALPFNNIMSLFMRSGQPEKVASLAEEMKKMNIKPDTFTYNLLMNSHSCLNDIEGVERVFEEMKQENEKQCNWTTYSNMAVLYNRGGHREKAVLALKNLEKAMSLKDREAYHFLISLYAGLSDLHNVHRIWKSLKSSMRTVTNMSYLIMLQALSNLNDISGMKKCYEEWRSVCSSYDIRLAKVAIGAYLAHDMLGEAESVLQDALERSNGPFFKAWETFMIFFLKKHQIQQALQFMEIATSEACDNEWRPRCDTIDGFLNHFKEQGDVTSAEEFYQFMKRINCVDSRVYESLLQTYVAAGRTLSDMRARIEGDRVEISSKLQDLLASVCPE
ncbi:pentatricopeptide repeat-containing protein At1g02370, mitochondrial-like isoform X1 [Sesamum indicum]|uniref:Pentatricopeptide repeat-containing protein At1g02370, mitochondrial-like isoform X1 n=2 Tax=Sesamum indicum TaxID=4182 RepID=A0A6I9T6D8_SESIN|nr:pentatricopeptide repeat-containing protein At1g02370, mitochondrial-like isoform X1 [Sesamum indicum]